MNIRLEEGCVVSVVLFYSLNGIERTTGVLVLLAGQCPETTSCCHSSCDKKY